MQCCGEPAISHDSHHVSLVQWTNPLIPITRDLGSNPLGGLMWNRDSPVSVSRYIWALWRSCNLTWFSPCLTGPVDYLFASRHKGLRFKSPQGYLSETGILSVVSLQCILSSSYCLEPLEPTFFYLSPFGLRKIKCCYFTVLILRGKIEDTVLLYW